MYLQDASELVEKLGAKIIDLNCNKPDGSDCFIEFEYDDSLHLVKVDSMLPSLNIGELIAISDILCPMCGNEVNRDSYFCNICKEHI